MTAKDPNIIECRVRPRAATADWARLRDVAASVSGITVATTAVGEELHIQATSPAAIVAMERALAAERLIVEVGALQVIYRDTLLRTVESECRIDGLDGSPDAFAVVRLRLVPLPRGSGVMLETEFEGPPPIDTFNAAVEQAARARAAAGVDGGRSLTDVRIVFTGGAFHPTRSDSAAFAAAATGALVQACRGGVLKRLEPVVGLGISAPRDDIRSLVNDLATLRGREIRRALTPKGIVVEAHMPLVVALSYPERLRTLTQGRARLISPLVFVSYADTPG